MAATNPNDGNTTITSPMLTGGSSYAWPNSGMRFGGAASGGWKDPTGSGAADANHAPPSWMQGAYQSMQGWAPPAGAGENAPTKLVVFGDLLADNGNAAAVEESLSQTPGYLTVPYSSTGDFSDGPKWTTGRWRKAATK